MGLKKDTVYHILIEEVKPVYQEFYSSKPYKLQKHLKQYLKGENCSVRSFLELFKQADIQKQYHFFFGDEDQLQQLTIQFILKKCYYEHHAVLNELLHLVQINEQGQSEIIKIFLKRAKLAEILFNFGVNQSIASFDQFENAEFHMKQEQEGSISLLFY